MNFCLSCYLSLSPLRWAFLWGLFRNPKGLFRKGKNRASVHAGFGAICFIEYRVFRTLNGRKVRKHAGFGGGFVFCSKIGDYTRLPN
jgi:hypothetical protein